jgi:hypothetical protein
MAGISSDTDFIRTAIKQYLISTYSNPPVKCDEVVDQKLGWVPTISCLVNNQLMLIEASEKPYPGILRMRRAEMAEVPKPIAAYAACPEEAYAQNQRDAADLALHGFGLRSLLLSTYPRVSLRMMSMDSRLCISAEPANVLTSISIMRLQVLLALRNWSRGSLFELGRMLQKRTGSLTHKQKAHWLTYLWHFKPLPNSMMLIQLFPLLECTFNDIEIRRTMCPKIRNRLTANIGIAGMLSLMAFGICAILKTR